MTELENSFSRSRLIIRVTHIYWKSSELDHKEYKFDEPDVSSDITGCVGIV